MRMCPNFFFLRFPSFSANIKLNKLLGGRKNVYSTYNVPDVPTVGAKAIQICQLRVRGFLNNLFFQRIRSMLLCLVRLSDSIGKPGGVGAAKHDKSAKAASNTSNSTGSGGANNSIIESCEDRARIAVGMALHLQACYVIDNIHYLNEQDLKMKAAAARLAAGIHGDADDGEGGDDGDVSMSSTTNTPVNGNDKTATSSTMPSKQRKHRKVASQRSKKNNAGARDSISRSSSSSESEDEEDEADIVQDEETMKPTPQRIEQLLVLPAGIYEQHLCSCFEFYGLDFNKWMEEN
jgi:hypothetical protein